jgi:hypothetical protein
MGMSMAGLTLFLSWLSMNYSMNENILKWGLLPIFGYGFAFGLNSFTQYVSCGNVNPSQIALGSIPVPVSIFLFLLLSLSGIVRAPIQSAVPLTLRLKYGGIVAITYYMFWAGMFGEAIAGGFSQSCGTTSATA